jgi:hypothetical protein
MQTHIAVSSGSAATLHLWMLLCFRVQKGRKDEIVIVSEEGKGHGTSQVV